MVCSSSLRKIIAIGFTLGFATLIIVRAVQRYQFGNECLLSHESELALADLALQDYNERLGLAGEQDSSSYNFNNMLQLIDIAQQTKNKIISSFGFAARRGKVSYEATKNLLGELTRERTQLREYLWTLKGHLRVNIPHKRYRALTYYIEVLDEMIIEIRALLPPKNA